MVSLATIRSRVSLLLNAAQNDGVWPASVGGNGRFPLSEEIDRTILLTDLTVRRMIQDAPGHPRRAPAQTVSGELSSGAALPDMMSRPGLVEVKDAANAWRTGLQAESRQQIEEARQYAGLFGGSNQTYGYYFLADGRIFHTGAAARVNYANLTLTGACQAPDEFEDMIVWGGVAHLLKDGGDTAQHQYYLNLWQNAGRGLGIFESEPERAERIATA